MRRGFTLIELLVVIAVIAILAAILFPVFARARAKARQASCLSNEKQIALVFAMYADDHDEMLPPGVYKKAGTYVAWEEHVMPYMKNAQVLICPEAKERAYGQSYPLLLCAFLGAFYSPSETVLICDIKKCFGAPGKVMNGTHHFLFVPSRLGSPPAKPANDSDDQPVAGDPSWSSRPRGLHNSGCNVAYLDGHAKWDKTEEFFYSQTPTDRFFDTQ